MPLGAPVKALYISSGFGYRIDPFLKRPAFHAGLDIVAEAGTIVRATAAGTVVSAGWNGGYGEMVEIKHADGVSTRYGHLSEDPGFARHARRRGNGDRPGRLDRALNRPAPPLRDAARRRGPSTRRSTSQPERRCAAAPERPVAASSSGGQSAAKPSKVSRMKPEVLTHVPSGSGKVVFASLGGR